MEWFTGLSLFTQFQHRSTFRCGTYADSFGLSLEDFVNWVRTSTNITSTVHKYGQSFLGLVCNRSEKTEDAMLVIADEYLPPGVAQEAAATVGLREQTGSYRVHVVFVFISFPTSSSSVDQVDSKVPIETTTPTDFVNEVLQVREDRDGTWAPIPFLARGRRGSSSASSDGRT